jgi:GT2 family glycosyltransferase
MSDILFSIVIPHWNGKHFLQPCLDSIRAQTHPQIEVIIVDNASSDGSQAYIKEHYPEVILIELDENKGFTGACNAGMEAATGDVISLLNNDTEVEPNWVEEIISAFDRHPEVGIIASKMILFNQRTHIHTTGDFFTSDGRAGNRGVWEEDSGQYDNEDYVFGACGGSSAYRKSMLDAIGLLDNDYFFLLEDIDLSWRAQLAGYQVLYVPTAIVYHHLSATGGGVTASFYDGRNSIWVVVKNLPAGLWRKYGLQIIKRQLSIVWEAMRAWRGEAARARLRGVATGIITLPSALRKRKHIQAMKTVSDDYIDSIITHT